MYRSPSRRSIHDSRPTHSRTKIFAEALRRQGSERTKYLDEVLGGDTAVRERIERLLRAHAEAESFLESPAKDPLATENDDRQVSERPGTVIGPYKLLQQIGEGGMGVVFMAEQSEPVQRTRRARRSSSRAWTRGR